MIYATGSASIHFVKYSMAITRYFIYSTAKGNGPECQSPRYGTTMGYRSTSTLLGRLVPVSMLLALLAALCIPRAVFPHGWPVVSCANNLRRESSAMTPAYPLVKFCHNACALLTMYTYQGGVSEPMSEQILVDQGVSARILFDYSGLCGFQREYPVSQVALVRGHPSLTSFNQANLH